MGMKHPAVRALIDEMKDSGSKVMRGSFSLYTHYPALLLLASEVFYHFMDTAKFDPDIYERVVAALEGASDQIAFELENAGRATPAQAAVRKVKNAQGLQLKAAFASDFLVVRQMIFEESGISGVPCLVTGCGIPSLFFAFVSSHRYRFCRPESEMMMIILMMMMMKMMMLLLLLLMMMIDMRVRACVARG